MKKAVFILLMITSKFVFATDYFGYIKHLQVEGVGDDYNTLWLDIDITDSPCSNTNSVDRLTIANDARQSAALAAFIAKKQVRVQTNGICKSDIEQINFIMLSADE